MPPGHIPVGVSLIHARRREHPPLLTVATSAHYAIRGQTKFSEVVEPPAGRPLVHLHDRSRLLNGYHWTVVQHVLFVHDSSYIGPIQSYGWLSVSSPLAAGSDDTWEELATPQPFRDASQSRGRHPVLRFFWRFRRMLSHHLQGSVKRCHRSEFLRGHLLEGALMVQLRHGIQLVLTGPADGNDLATPPDHFVGRPAAITAHPPGHAPPPLLVRVPFLVVPSEHASASVIG